MIDRIWHYHLINCHSSGATGAEKESQKPIFRIWVGEDFKYFSSSPNFGMEI